MPHGGTLGRLEALGLAAGTADAVVCNLAVHYFLADQDSLRNFVGLVRGAVRPGGKVILTVMRGEAVHAAFLAGGIAAGGTWDLREGDTLKYSLRRMYTSDRLEPTGQKIGVLLPFSGGEYYEEYLVNSKSLSAAFGIRGFRLLEEVGVAGKLPAFEAHNRAVFRQLTEADRKYLGLYGELVYELQA